MSSDPRLIRILTVDDHALLRKGIAALVNAEPDMKLVAEASNGAEAITEVKKHRPDVTLIDLQMPVCRRSSERSTRGKSEFHLRSQSNWPNIQQRTTCLRARSTYCD